MPTEYTKSADESKWLTLGDLRDLINSLDGASNEATVRGVATIGGWLKKITVVAE